MSFFLTLVSSAAFAWYIFYAAYYRIRKNITFFIYQEELVRMTLPFFFSSHDPSGRKPYCHFCLVS